MIPPARLKREVQFTTELTDIMDVLKGIAAARYHALERELTISDRHLAAAGEFMRLAARAAEGHPFVAPRSPTVGVVLVTSDMGFLGGLNTRIVQAGLKAAGPEGVLTVIGERGAGAVRGLRRLFTGFPGVQETGRPALAAAVRDHLVRQMLTGTCGRQLIVYAKPVGFGVQEVATDTLFPCTAWVSAGAEPVPASVLWESSPAEVIEYVVTYALVPRLLQLFALSRLAELSARVIHLDGSHQELERLGKTLRHRYFRARHEVMDRGLREVVTAQQLSAHAESPVE